jgi:hypothetical protein
VPGSARVPCAGERVLANGELFYGRSLSLDYKLIGGVLRREDEISTRAHVLPGVTAQRAWPQCRIRRSVSAVCLNDYLNETSSMRKVVDSEKSVVQRNCSRTV